MFSLLQAFDQWQECQLLLSGGQYNLQKQGSVCPQRFNKQVMFEDEPEGRLPADFPQHLQIERKALHEFICHDQLSQVLDHKDDDQ